MHSFKTILAVLVFLSLLITGCSESQTAYVVKETTQEIVDPVPPPPEPIIQQTKPIPTSEHISTTHTTYAGETITIQDTSITIKDSGTSITFSTANENLNLRERDNGTIGNITISLKNVSRERKESSGYVEFWYSLGKKMNMYTLEEQESKTFKDTATHTITLAFLGTSGNASAVFIVNGQRTKPLEEKESFYFKDGSVIFVENIMQRKSPSVVLTTQVTFEVLQ